MLCFDMGGGGALFRAPPSEGARHAGRVAKISALEQR